MRTKNRRAEMGTWFLLVVLLISSTASSENVTGCVLKDPGMHFISLGNRTVLKVGENANVSCKFGYQIVPNIYSEPAYEYEYPDSESTADPSEMPETEDNATLVSVKDGNYTCRDNGKWEPEIRFSCKQIICDSFYGYNFENGHIFYSSRYAYTVGTVASFRCNPGYIRHGPDNRTCQIDGTWSGECVTCQRIIRNPSITCPVPCVPDGARKTGSHTYEIGSRVDFHCPRSKTQDRHDRSRSKYCIKNGEYASWNGTSINCKKIICDKGDHYGFENGKVTYSSSIPTVGTKAVFMCNPGYNQRGPMTRICQKDGTWSRGCVTCQKHQHNWSTCPAPCVPDGAKKIGSLSYEIGSRIQFYCFQFNVQYKVETRYIRHCVNDGKSASWNGTNINCKAKCEPLTDTYKIVQNGVVPGILSDKTVVELSCSRSLAPVLAECRNGHWYPTCEDRCFIEPTINLEHFIGHEKVLENYIHSGILMHARCSNRMELFRLSSYLEREQVSVKCYLGKLEPASLVCKDKRCNITITTIENGHFRNRGNVIVAGEKIHSGSTIQLLCYAGYELYNKTNSMYLELEHTDIKCYQGSFIPETPSCEPKRCNITITRIENGHFRNRGNEIVAGEKIHSGSNIQLLCYAGYELYNKTNSMYLELEHTDIKCYQGSFIPETPSCEPKRCNITITRIENGHFRDGGNEIVAGEKINSGSNIQLLCYDGYELYNKTNSMYLELEHTDIKCYQGSFIPETPSCEPKRCNITITTIENGHFRNRGNVIVAGDKIHSGSNITLECFDGYELFNQSISKFLGSEKTDILCYQGSFTVAFPKCKLNPIQCGEFSELTNLNQQGQIDIITDALDGAWPWMVNLEDELNIHQCGATLLNENWILTAAHCEIKPGWKIYIGRLDRSDTGANFIETSMAKTIRHNKYNDRTFLHNIRLVKLANPVFYNTKKPYAVPVCLYNATEFPELNYEDLFKPKSRGVVTGWEKQINDGRFPATLKQLQLPILNDAICQDFAAKNTQQTFNASVNFCALRKGADKTVDACEGNSGGPFVVKVDKLDSSKRRKAVFIQTGIVSWGFKCGIYMPDYYVRLTPEMIKWINDQISEK